MELNRTPNPLDREARNKENINWDRIERLSKVLNDLVLNSGGDSNLEVVQARGGESTLNDRINRVEDKTNSFKNVVVSRNEPEDADIWFEVR